METFIAAVAGVISKIKIIHIHGGELTFGSRDDLYRHAITKNGKLPFCFYRVLQKKIKTNWQKIKITFSKSEHYVMTILKRLKTVNKNF